MSDTESEDTPQYEYKVVRHDGDRGDYPLEKVLNIYGEKGWRYVGDMGDSHVILERLEKPAVVTQITRDDGREKGILQVFK